MSRTSDFRRSLILRIGFERRVEVFLVSAVVSVLCIRAGLSITGYPQIGGGGLHVAHVLFGGIGMAVALVLMMVSLTEPAINLAAVIGGVGFGAFIDDAQRAPVRVMRRDRVVGVMVSAQDYEAMRAFYADRLQQTMDRVAEQAARAGLSQEKLAELLADER